MPTEYYQDGATDYRRALAPRRWTRGVRGGVDRGRRGAAHHHRRRTGGGPRGVRASAGDHGQLPGQRLRAGPDLPRPLPGREPAVAAGSAALLANAMEQPTASRIPLFTAADFAWNPRDYRPQESWQAAIDDLAGRRRAGPRRRCARSPATPPPRCSAARSPAYLRPLLEEFWRRPPRRTRRRRDRAAVRLRAAFTVMREAPGRLSGTADSPTRSAVAGPAGPVRRGRRPRPWTCCARSGPGTRPPPGPPPRTGPLREGLRPRAGDGRQGRTGPVPEPGSRRRTGAGRASTRTAHADRRRTHARPAARPRGGLRDGAHRAGHPGGRGGARAGPGLAQARRAVRERLHRGCDRRAACAWTPCGSWRGAPSPSPYGTWCRGSPTSRRPASISSAAGRTPRSAADRGGAGVRLTALRPAEVRGELTAKAPAGHRGAGAEGGDGAARRSGRRCRSRSRSRPGTPGRGVRVPLSFGGAGAHADGARLSAHRRAPTSPAPAGPTASSSRRRDGRLPGVGGDRRRPEDPLVLPRRGRRLVAAGAGPPGPARAGGAALAGRVRDGVPRPGLGGRPHLAHGGDGQRRPGRPRDGPHGRAGTPATSASRARSAPPGTATRCGRWRRTRSPRERA